MRSFEIPAIGTCMLAEYTKEHKQIFGEDLVNIVYFREENDLIKKIKWLLENNNERIRLAKSAHTLIRNERHTYKDRLQFIINEAFKL